MDVKIVETGDGGDLVKTAKDIVVIDGLENMPYLALFGGNVSASTPVKKLTSEQNFDWWGNSLLIPNNPGVQFNSETERALNTIPLTSAGRSLIENAVRMDLKFMKTFARVAIAVAIVATDKIVIGIQLFEPDNQQKREFIYIWDATKRELDILPTTSRGGTVSTDIGFDYTLNFVFI